MPGERPGVSSQLSATRPDAQIWLSAWALFARLAPGVKHTEVPDRSSRTDLNQTFRTFRVVRSLRWVLEPLDKLLQ
jgi:hypothetical protein